MSDAELRLFRSLDALPPSAQALFDRAEPDSLFLSRPWFETFVAAGLLPGAEPLFLVLGDADGRARAALPCQRLAAPSRSSDPTLSSLTSFYACDFRPLIASGLDPVGTAFDLGRGVARWLAPEAVARFDSLDSTSPMLEPFLAGLARPGRALLRYAHFGRWRENVADLSFKDYLARRDGALREVIRRKGNLLRRAGAVFQIIGPDDLERGVADYEAVYAASWKNPEPFPLFQPTLIRKLSAAGWLRLAICRLGERPIAAQLWATAGGTATVLKLAHDTAFDRLSPGTVLTAFAVQAAIDADRVARLDFGRGDDAYKRGWASARTPHIGVLSVSIARRPTLVARHMLGGFFRKHANGDG